MNKRSLPLDQYVGEPTPGVTFGAAVRKARKEAGQTLKAVADGSGISITFLADIELGRRMPSRPVLLKMAVAMGIPAENLLRFDMREGLVDFAAMLQERPDAGRSIMLLCRRIRSGEVTERELARMAKG